MDFNTHLNSPVPSNNVSLWKPILVEQTSGNTMLLASMGGSKIMPLKDVPSFFVHRILRVSPESPAAKNKQYLIEKARSYIPVDSPSQKMAAFMTRLPLEESTQLHEILNGFIAERLQHMLAEGEKPPCPSCCHRLQTSSTGDPIAVTSAIPVFPKRKRNDVSPRKNDLEDRLCLEIVELV